MASFRVCLVSAVMLSFGLLSACSGTDTSESKESATTTRAAEATMPAINDIEVTSDAFADGAPIPATYSCTGANQSPPLTWTVHASADRLALIMDDPDAVGGTFTHWVVTDIPTTTTSAPAGRAPDGGVVSTNSSGRAAYLGPCPPAGTGVHHYRFTIHTLPHPLDLDPETPVAQAISTIEAASLGYGRLTGTYTG
ncbi:YbhB/YbcL family Raf kinase inhibitor-like protein [Nocardia sp. NPDC050193]